MSKVLLIDDSRDQLDAIARAAHTAGFAENEISRADTEEQARELIRTHHFQLAVVDIMLTPDMMEEGLRLIAYLAGSSPDCRIIALTTKAGTEAGVKALRAGADDFVSSRWQNVNWVSLLSQRMMLWKGLIEEQYQGAPV